MLIKFQKIIFKYLKNMKTCAPTGATVIGCKCYRVQLVLGATVFHRYSARWLLSLLEKKMFPLIHCNFVFISMVYHTLCMLQHKMFVEFTRE